MQKKQPSSFAWTVGKSQLCRKRFAPKIIRFVKVEEVIGAGGFGKVFRGYYRGHEVAVKAGHQTVQFMYVRVCV